MTGVRDRNSSAWLLPNDGTRANHRLRDDMRRFGDTEEVDLAEVVRGETLLHDDIRSDNLLLTPEGRVVFVDWGMPCKGAAWQDLMMFALTPDLYLGADPDVLVRNHPLTRDVPPSSIDVVVLAGYATGRLWVDRGDDRLSAYHRAGAQASARWVRCRAARVD